MNDFCFEPHAFGASHDDADVELPGSKKIVMDELRYGEVQAMLARDQHQAAQSSWVRRARSSWRDRAQRGWSRRLRPRRSIALGV